MNTQADLKSVMTTSPTTCAPSSKLEEVARMMKDQDCGQIPVVDENGKPAGVVTDRDIVVRALATGKNPLELTARDVMSSPCEMVKVSDSLSACCELMEKKQIRRVLVVDDGGKLCGIVAQADVARVANAEKTAHVVEKISKPS